MQADAEAETLSWMDGVGRFDRMQFIQIEHGLLMIQANQRRLVEPALRRVQARADQNELTTDFVKNGCNTLGCLAPTRRLLHALPAPP